MVASILHLGNVDFIAGKEHDSSILKDDLSKVHLDAVAELLKYDSAVPVRMLFMGVRLNVDPSQKV